MFHYLRTINQWGGGGWAVGGTNSHCRAKSNRRRVKIGQKSLIKNIAKTEHPKQFLNKIVKNSSFSSPVDIPSILTGGEISSRIFLVQISQQLALEN
jgi:hypothetical protein